MATERSRRRPRRQLGLEASAKEHLAHQIASVVALSLQQNRLENGTEELPRAGGKEGLLASKLRLAARNVADMTAFLRRKEAEDAAVVASGFERGESCAEEEEVDVCVICLEEKMVAGEGGIVEALPCGHVFHARCIAQWLGYRRVCPVDRRTVD